MVETKESTIRSTVCMVSKVDGGWKCWNKMDAKSGLIGVTLIKGFHRYEARASVSTSSAATNALRYTGAELGSSGAPRPRIITDVLYLCEVEE